MVFHVNVSTSECSLTPGHGIVIFLPASAINFWTGTFLTSEIKTNKIKIKKKIWKFIRCNFSSFRMFYIYNNIYKGL